MKRFSNIVYVTEANQQDDFAMARAAELARVNRARLTVIGFYNNLNRLLQSQWNADKVLSDLLDFKKEQLKQHCDQFTSGLNYEIKIFQGDAFLEILAEVLNFDRDLLIKPIEEPSGFNKLFFGSLDMKLTRKCPCPVWLLKPLKQSRYKDIVVALDYKPESEETDELNTQLLSMAMSLAHSNQSDLHVTHAWQLPYEEFLRSSRMQSSKDEVDLMVQQEKEQRIDWINKKIKQCISQLTDREKGEFTIKIHMIEGHAKHVISKLINDLSAELTVMGTIGRAGIPGYVIGNTAETILNNIDCSVLTVKPKNFVCPVKLI